MFIQIAKPLQCPDCDIDMRFLVSQSTKRVFASTIVERALFVCPNCQRVSHRLVAVPLEFIKFAPDDGDRREAGSRGARH